MEKVLKGHRVSRGKVQGIALVSHSPISFMGGVNPETGKIVEKGHELEGVSIAGKILVFPLGKGSTAGSFKIYEMKICHTHPSAIINERADPVVAIGAILSQIPMIDRLTKDTLAVIKTGDHVEVDADMETVSILNG